MSRVQLALNVDDLESAISFYEDLFGVPPHKVRDGYANFAVADPPVKLVLFEAAGAADRLNHLGIEVQSTDEVAAATRRLTAVGLRTDVREAETCCHATQDKVWVDGPSGHRWEVYAITDDDPALAAGGHATSDCCAQDGADTEPENEACCVA